MVPRRAWKPILRGRQRQARGGEATEWIACAVLAGAALLSFHPRPARAQPQLTPSVSIAEDPDVSSIVSTAGQVGSTVPSSSTTSSSTTSTMPFEYDSFTVLGAFPLQRLFELSIRVEVDAGDQNVYVPASAGNCFGTLAGAEVSYDSNGVFRIDFRPLQRRYAQTQVVLACHYSTQEPNGAAAWKFELVSAIAVGGEEQKETTALCILQYDDRNPRLKLESHYFCGDAVVDETVTTVDALKVLRAALGLESCMLNRCDTDTSGRVTAADALRTLHFAVGKAVSMLCSGCSP